MEGLSYTIGAGDDGPNAEVHANSPWNCTVTADSWCCKHQFRVFLFMAKTLPLHHLVSIKPLKILELTTNPNCFASFPARTAQKILSNLEVNFIEDVPEYEGHHYGK